VSRVGDGRRSTSFGERGSSLAELVIVLALVTVAVLVLAVYSLPWLHAEEARSAVYQTQMFLQLARVEAITRNRACRFEIDGDARRIRVYDLNDPSDSTDDLPIADATLSSRVSFGAPGGGAAITLTHASGATYHATFSPDGSVSSGSGSISIQGRDQFERIALYGAGGTRVERWNGSAWEPRP